MQLPRWLAGAQPTKETTADDRPATYAIGDIHGCLEPLDQLLEKIAPRPEDELVFVGDYIDRGPQSREVVDRLLALPHRCVFLMGNHERMLLDFLAGEEEDIYLENGGRATLASYGGDPDHIPAAHLAETIQRFLILAATFCPKVLREFEVNPLVVSEGRLVALDAVAVMTPPGHEVEAPRTARPIEKIERLLQPRSIALVGVSETAMNPGRIILRNILGAGFDRERLTIVKGDCDAIDGVRCAPSLAALPAEPGGIEGRADLIVLSVSAAASTLLLEEIAREERAESVILIPGGLDENPKSRALVSRMHWALESVRAGEWRGPVVNGGNCLGIRSVPGRYNTLFIPAYKLPVPERPADPIALITGSGAFAVSMSSRLAHVNPVYTITVGNQMDLTAADYLEYLKADPRVEVFAVYLEGFRPLDGARFLKFAAEITESGRTVILYRGGRTEAGSAAASTRETPSGTGSS